jgi:hypothetical protein
MSLPLSGPEIVSPAARPAALVPTGPYPVLAVMEARLLGLHDGQIVRPTIEVRNDRLQLLLDGRVVEWPGSAAPRASASVSSWLATAWVVRLLANGSAQLLPWRGQESAAAAVQTRAPASQPGTASAPPPSDAAASTTARGLSAAAELAQWRMHWAPLLVRSDAWTAWRTALQGMPQHTPGAAMAPASAAGTGAGPGAPTSQPQSQPQALLQAKSLATTSPAPAVPLPSMALLDPVSLREAVRRSGLFVESRLARGALVDDSDVKIALLARLSSAVPVAGPDRAAMSAALDDIAAAQLQSLAASLDGSALMQLVLGFRDAPAVSMRLARDPDPDQGTSRKAQGWTVDIQSRSDKWGSLWLQTRIEPDGRIGLMMWCEREDVCTASRADARRLANLLLEEGLRLERFQVILGPRQDNASGANVAETGNVLDLQA